MKNNNFRPISVEKIGGTCMSRYDEVVEKIILNEDLHKAYVKKAVELTGLTEEDFPPFPYGRIFVVSALGGVTDKLIGDKKGNSGGFYQELMDMHSLVDIPTNEDIDEMKNKVKNSLCELGENLSLMKIREVLESKYREAVKSVDCLGITPCEDYLSDNIWIVSGFSVWNALNRYGRGYSEVTFSHLCFNYNVPFGVIHKEFPLCAVDPKLIKGGAKPIEKMSYSVGIQLADIGMEAIHPRAMRPLRDKGISLFVREAFGDNLFGTMFYEDDGTEEKKVEVVSGNETVTAFQVKTADMIDTAGFELGFIEIFQKHGLNYIMKSTDTDSIVSVFRGDIQNHPAFQEIKDKYKDYSYRLMRCSLVCIVGSRLDALDVLLKTSAFFAKKKINILCANLAIQGVNAQFLIEEKEYSTTIKGLYEEFIGGGK